MSVHYIPKDHHSIAPYFVVKSVHSLIDFLTSSFGAEVVSKMQMPDGRIAHAEIKIGDSLIMAGERPDSMKNCTHLYLKDVDAAYDRCLKAGGKSLAAPTTHPYGDRGAGVEDPEGNVWWISTHVEDVSEAEVIRRMSQKK
jgi:PhnB protein